MLNVDDILGGLWIPGDGVGDPHLFCMALMREAVEKGSLPLVVIRVLTCLSLLKHRY